MSSGRIMFSTEEHERRMREQIRQVMLNNQSRLDANTGVVMGVNGMMMGPKGDTGERGPVGTPGVAMERYILSYAGIPFRVTLKPETFSMIEDATQLNGDELSFIKMVDETEWKSIREAWAEEWNKRKAYRAFEFGEMMPDE